MADPAASGAFAADVRLLAQPFAAARALEHFAATMPQSGAVVSFLGQVRSAGLAGSSGAVEALELRHYPPLTLPAMQGLAGDAGRNWALDGLLVLHRTGLLGPGDPIVLVAAAARHRRDAFAAADFTMDHLKSEAWFWKRERIAGVWRWVEPRPEDYADIARWG